MLRNIFPRFLNILPRLPKYPDVRGRWLVEYSRDIILSGHIDDDKLFVVYMGDPRLEFRSDLLDVRTITPAAATEHVTGVLYLDRQFLSIAWGVFYWSLSGSHVKHIYDVRCDFLDTGIARIELTTPDAHSKFHRTFLANDEIFSSEERNRIINDHIVGLVRVFRSPKHIWGATTSILGDRNEVFVSLPYFSAVPVTQEQSGSVEPVQPPRRGWKVDWKWLLPVIIAIVGIVVPLLIEQWR